MSDRRTNDITRAAGDALDAFKQRNSWHPVTGDNGMWQHIIEEVQIALRTAATDAYQRGAGWGLQQHQPITVNINCPHTEVTDHGNVG